MSQRRIYQTRCPYLITTNTFNGEPLFNDMVATTILSEHIIDWAAIYKVELLSWIIMPDHWHLLCRLREEAPHLSIFMMKCKSTTARAIQRFARFKPLLHQFSHGPIWQKRFNTRLMDTPMRLKRAINYIHDNPRRKNLSAEFFQYPYYFLSLVVKQNYAKLSAGWRY